MFRERLYEYEYTVEPSQLLVKGFFFFFFSAYHSCEDSILNLARETVSVLFILFYFILYQWSCQLLQSLDEF